MWCLLPVCTSSAGGMGEVPRLETGSAQAADALWQEAHQQADAEQEFLGYTAHHLHGMAASSHLCVEMGMLHLLNSL